MDKIKKNLQHVEKQLKNAAESAGRQASEIRLVAVSKKHPVEAIDVAYHAGQRDFGENYLQEALEKITALQQYADIHWHFIGAIQSNKTRPIAEHFDWVHTVDRTKIARRLSEQRPPEKGPLNICLQVNLSNEATKSGVLLNETGELAREIKDLPNIRLRGLMAIPVATNDKAEQHALFAAMKKQLDDLNSQGFELDTLSMGMSHDMEVAVMEGATMVRVGTAIFGSRE